MSLSLATHCTLHTRTLNLQQEQLALRAAQDVVSVQIFSHAVKSTKFKVAAAVAAAAAAAVWSPRSVSVVS